MELILIFDSLSLVETVFKKGEVTARCSRRRYPTNPYTGCFSWTSAVKAFAVLMLYGKRDSRLVGDDSVVLKGGAGSMAASLDYALDRNAAWMNDIFGTGHGAAFMKRFIYCNNPRRRRGKLVVLSLRDEMNKLMHVKLQNTSGAKLSDTDIDILITRILNVSATISIENYLSFGKKNDNDSRMYQLPNQKLTASLIPIFCADALHGLQSRIIFEKGQFESEVSRIWDNKAFKKLAGKKTNVVHSCDLKLSESHRFGKMRDENLLLKALTGVEPIRCAIAADLLIPIVILHYLRDVKCFNIQVDYTFAHTIEVLDCITGAGLLYDEYDLVILTIASFARFLSICTEYLPFMLMPHIGYEVLGPGVVSPPPNLKTSTSSYHFMTDLASTTAFVFQDLQDLGIVHGSEVAVVDADSSQTAAAMAGGDESDRSICWFPHYHLNVMFNQCKIYDYKLADGVSSRQTFLVAL
jgi:hypothetical protein